MGNARHTGRHLLLALAAMAAVGSSLAQSRDAARLGKDLTPAGGEQAASKDGSIPAYTGAEPPEAGWAWGKLRGEFWKHKGEKPLYSVDASNVDKYADKLSPGQVELIKQTKGYRMDVYPSHRSCGVPDFVADNTRKNVEAGKLKDNGWTLQEALLPGYPFPMPRNGAEAMWNAKMRYRGLALDYKKVITAASPRKGSEEWIKAGSEQVVFVPWGAKGSVAFSKLPQVEYYTYFGYNSPTALAGQALAITNYSEAATETFYYFPGQRRVRRAPQVAYDNPGTASDGMRTSDQLDMFNGGIDRYDWKLIGKEEVYVPYNSYKLHSDSLKVADIVTPMHINQEHTRYELHRVWVVEATLKEGKRHIYAKRRFYVDEDSWGVLVVDQYDNRGRLWRVSEGHSINYYDILSFWTTLEVHIDLLSGRYLAHGLDNENDMYDFSFRSESGDYTPAALRRHGRR
jgi:hypothetical protein